MFLYVGRYVPGKNLRMLCGAMDKLDDGNALVIIGPDPIPPHGRDVRTLACEGDAQHSAAAMASVGAFVHAGDQETSDLVASEVMASRMPIVAHTTRELSELTDERVGYVVSRRVTDDFVQALDTLRQRDPAALMHATHHHAVQYDWRTVLPQLLRCHLTLFGRQTSTAAETFGPAHERVHASRSRQSRPHLSG